MFHLQKRFIQAVVLIGADEYSGLSILRPAQTDQAINTTGSAIFDYLYRPQILTTFTESSAIRPHFDPTIDPFYPPRVFLPPDASSAAASPIPSNETNSPHHLAGGMPSLSKVSQTIKFKGAWRKGSEKLSLKTGQTAGRTLDKRRGSVVRRTRIKHLQDNIEDQTVSSSTIEGLPNLLYPNGIAVSNSKFAPSIGYLVLTAMNGERRYVMTLTFARPFIFTNKRKEGKYVLLAEDEDLPLWEELEEQHHSEDDLAFLKSKAMIYIPNTILLISGSPYYSTMKDLISLLSKEMEISSDKFYSTLSDFAACVTHTMASPDHGNVTLEMTLLDQSLRIPPPLPVLNQVVDFDLTLFTKALQLGDLVLLVTALLMQKRVVMVSRYPVLTTLSCEGLLLLIQPFVWRFTYVPWLPEKFLEFLEAPGPFLYGFDSTNKEHILQAEDVICVDLDNGILEFSNNMPRTLPSAPKKAIVNLEKNLKHLCKDYELNHLSCVEPTSIEMVRESRFQHRRSNQEVIIFSFLKFNVDCFRSVMNYIQSGGSSPHSGQVDSVFRQDAFLRSQSEENVEFYKEVVNAEIFASFLRGRLRSEDDAWTKVEKLTRNESSESITASLGRSGQSSSSNRLSQSNAPSSASLERGLFDAGSGGLEKSYFSNLMADATDTGQCKYISLPPYFDRASTNFYEKLVNDFTLRIDTETVDSVKATLHFLRADCYYSIGKHPEAFRDLFFIFKMRLNTVKANVVRLLILQMNRDTLHELEKCDFFPELKALCGVRQGEAISLDNEDTANVRPFTLPRQPLPDQEFYQFCEQSEITYLTEVQEALFKCLTLDQPVARMEVDEKLLRQFYEQWTENINNLENEVNTDLLIDNECILKVSSVIRVDYVGTGSLVMTQMRLLFVPAGQKKVFHLVWYKDISGVTKTTLTTGIFIKKSTNMVQITASNISLPPSHKSSSSASSSSINTSSDGGVSILAWLREESDIWLCLITELWSGHICASHQRDNGLINRAVDNCLILDTAFYCASEEGGMMIPSVRNYFSRRKQKIIALMTPFTAMRKSGRYELPELTKQMLQLKVDPEPTDLYGKSIAHLLPIAVPSSSAREEIWCVYNGNNCGKLVQLMGPQMTSSKLLLKSKFQLLSMVKCGDCVWLGDSGGFITILKVDEKVSEKISFPHGDMVHHLAALEAADSGNSRVLSATQSGKIFIWNAATKEIWYQWEIREQKVRLKGIDFCGDALVVCCQLNSVTIYPIHGDTPLAQFSPSNFDLNIPVCSLGPLLILPGERQSSMRISDYSIFVAHGSNSVIHLLYLQESRDKATNKMSVNLVQEASITIEHMCNAQNIRPTCQECRGDVLNPCSKCKTAIYCHGISKLLIVDKKLWAPCKDGTIFMLNLTLNSEPLCVQGHRSAVECICLTKEKMVFTGGRSDNRIAMWNTLM